MYRGFYNPSEKLIADSWNNEKTIFSFDTNVFLNLYGYADQTRLDFYQLLDAIKDRIWIPYHVGLEYQRRRLEVIKNEKAIFNRIGDNLKKIEKIFDSDFKKLELERRFPDLHADTNKLCKDIQKLISNYRKSVTHWDKKQPCVRSHDAIRDKLNDLLNGKVGDKPTDQTWLNDLYKEGEERYKNKVPPGFKDSDKAKDSDRYYCYDDLKYDPQFGDLILWKQLIDKSKSDDIENVIFITDDSKEDWWYILDSRGDKQIGPHANLQSEIYSKANIKLFHMYNTSSFLENGKKILKIGVHDSSISDANIAFQNSIQDTKASLNQEIYKLIEATRALNDSWALNVNNKHGGLMKQFSDIANNRDKFSETLSNDIIKKIQDDMRIDTTLLNYKFNDDIADKWRAIVSSNKIIDIHKILSDIEKKQNKPIDEDEDN